MISRFLDWVQKRLIQRQKGNLVKYAESELKLAGFSDIDSDYEGMLAEAVMELVKVFSHQGHSGFSAGRTIQLFQKVASFEPLIPLTGDNSEWNEVEAGIYQNKRCSHVFKEKGQAYDSEGKIFKDNAGTYTSKDSRVPIIFPYYPRDK